MNHRVLLRFLLLQLEPRQLVQVLIARELVELELRQVGE
jgi:hypothetical protein